VTVAKNPCSLVGLAATNLNRMMLIADSTALGAAIDECSSLQPPSNRCHERLWISGAAGYDIGSSSQIERHDRTRARIRRASVRSGADRKNDASQTD
jgi:hypothetical protein